MAAICVAALLGCTGSIEEGAGDVDEERAASPPRKVLSGAALFVVADATAVGAGDLAVRQRLEGLGLSVDTKSDGKVKASDAGGKRVVVISSSVDSTLLGSMFTTTAVPLVTWEHALLDELGMATESGQQAGASLEILHAAHAAAGGQSGKPSIQPAGQLRWGTPGAGAAVIATTLDSRKHATQFVYEAGAPLTSGAAAPARRVGTFLDHASSQSLTGAGWALFDAGIVWATSGKPPALPPVCELAGKALFVVADASQVGAGDQAVRKRLEELGLKVTTKSDGQTKAQDATGMQLIVISSSVESQILGNTFREVSVPLVTWEHALYDDLGMGSSDAGTDADETTLDLVDSTHPLAARLTGNVPVLNAKSAVRWGKPVASAKVVARVAGSGKRAAHFAIEQGAALTSGTAPARRVGTFLDAASSQQLSPAGWSLFDAAIVWAMGGGAARPSAVLVTGDHNLEPGDGAVKNRLEQLGFAVRVVRQKQLRQTSLAGVRLVVITESTQSEEIGNYFADRPIPAVIAEYNLLDDMGMATGRGTTSTKELDIVKPASPLAGNQTGRVQVYKNQMEAAWGQPAAGAEIVATLKGEAGKATVFGFETGAALLSGPAAARRVGLFMFHGHNLTTAGWALFDAAVSWAASPPVENVCGDGRDTEVGPCVKTVCDSSGCHPTSRPDGAACDDGQYCSTDDMCQAGVCVGKARSCEGSVDACTTATCDEAEDTCVATPREETCEDTCSTPAGLAAYRAGWAAGHQRVHRSWRKTDDCDALEDFLDRVSVRLEALLVERDAADSAGDRRCRLSGKLDGSYAALEQIQLTCDDACVLRGALVGSAAATAYCELAIDANGAIQVDDYIRGPVNLCGLSHEVTCDSVFIGETASYSNSTGTCEKYTKAPFFEVWDGSRERSCAYDNAPDMP